jgi:hypothetical protein
MRTVHDRGGSAFMLTLTMRHTRGDRLGLSTTDRRRRDLLEERRADREVAEANGWDVDERAAEAEEIELAGIKDREGCWDVLGYAWAAVTSGSTWVKDSCLFGGLLGWARVVEVTDGANGWHVHVHALLCFADDVSAELVAAGVGARMFGRWRRALERKGFDASDEHGWDLRKAQLGEGDLADYFTKMAHEVTGAGRQARSKPRWPHTDAAPRRRRRHVRGNRYGPVVGMGGSLRRSAPTHLVSRATRPPRTRRARARGHRRGDCRRGPGS